MMAPALEPINRTESRMVATNPPSRARSARDAQCLAAKCTHPRSQLTHNDNDPSRMLHLHPMTVRLSLGTSDFRQLREGGFAYVDKTRLIADIIDSPTQVFLIPRPRRFGKTLNLTTLRYFFERGDQTLQSLFEGLHIWESDDTYRAHHARYPVLYLTFKDIRSSSWASCREALAGVIGQAHRDHLYLLDSPQLHSSEKNAFERLVQGEASDATLWASLGHLARQLREYHQERIIILIDEYDTPLHAAFFHGYHDQLVELFRNVLSSGLKDNPNLFKGVLTGVLRIACESIFFGLNNLGVFSILRRDFGAHFGFTEPEVERLARSVGAPEVMDDLRKWYDGYLFGTEAIFNPWSVLNFLADDSHAFQPYWITTGSDDIIRSLIIERGRASVPDIEDLLHGRTIEKPIDEHIVFRDVMDRPDTLWSFLLFSGYLKATEVRQGPSSALAQLAIPNLEVKRAYYSIFARWLEQEIGGQSQVNAMIQGLLAGDEATFGQYLSTVLRTTASYHDLAGSAPERVYHAFVLGLLVQLEPRYHVRSNRESGYGRCDVMLEPKSTKDPGVILEFKVVDNDRKETVDRALEGALEQIRNRAYATELRSRGVTIVHEIAVTFDGKRAWTKKWAPEKTQSPES